MCQSGRHAQRVCHSLVPEIILSITDSLEALLPFNKAVILTVILYYNQKMQDKFSKGRKPWNRVKKQTGRKFQASSPIGITWVIFNFA